MPNFSKKFGDVKSIIISSLLFTLGYALNPGIQILPIINLFLDSMIFSMIYHYTGNLFIVGLGHGLWNFSQGYIFGAEVSENVITSSLLKSIPTPGKELISGGIFGFEGGLVTTILEIIIILIFAKLSSKENNVNIKEIR